MSKRAAVVLATIIFVFSGCTHSETVTPLQDEVTSILTEPVENSYVDTAVLSDIEIIRQYYLYLSKGELKEAYNFYAEKNPDFETYVDWYKDVKSVNLTSIDQKTDRVYNIMVELIEEWPGTVQHYDVVMRVENGKIRTESAERIVAESVTIKDVIIESQTRFERNRLLATRKGETRVIEEADADFLKKIGTTRYFFDVQASPLENYFTYSSTGWEWGEEVIVDLRSLQEVLRLDGSLYGFSPDESIVYQCSANDLSGGYYAHIYSVPEFKIVQTLIEPNTVWISNCELNEGVLEISYFPDGYEGKERMKTYNLTTGAVNDALVR